MTTVFYARLYGAFIEINSNSGGKIVYGMNQGSNFSGRKFTIQYNLEEKDSPNIFKKQRSNPSIFTSVAPKLLDWSKETS